jgi:hypothetical protein
MKKLIVISNHELTNEQIKDANKNLNVNKIEYLPQNLKEKWGNINPEFSDTEVYEHIKPIKDFIHKNVNIDDYILVQGEFTATFSLVDTIFRLGGNPIVATTQRVVKEIKEFDKVVKISKFKHIRYRPYFY